MSKELIVSTGRHETRVAILEDDQIVELFHEREKEYSLAGSIHKGRVTRVLPGMQSAFVDIGLERDAFLYVSDFFEDNEEYDAVVSGVEEKILKMEKGDRASDPGPVADYTITAAAESTVPPAIASVVSAPSVTPELRGESQRENRGHDRGGNLNRGAGERSSSVATDNSADRRAGGRRGRRRRGGRGPTGIPDSKFYSPKEDDAKEDERDEQGSGIVDLPGERRHVSSPPPAQSSYPSLTPSSALPSSTSPSSASASFSPPSFTSPSSSVDDDFMVLPGESLAKYSSGDAQPAGIDEESESDGSMESSSAAPQSRGADAVLSALVDDPPAEAPAAVHERPAEASSGQNQGSGHEAEPASNQSTAIAIPGEPVVENRGAEVAEATVHAPESALPFEHPLAGLGVVPGWAPEPAQEPHSKNETSGAVQQAVAEKLGADPGQDAPRVGAEEPTAAEEELELELAGEAAETTAELDGPDSPEGESLDADSLDPESLQFDVVEAEALDAEVLDASAVEGESVEGDLVVEAEAPEPARIPTSLTATLREQGHRYPHRVSRRMRRKMRGGQPGEGQPAEGQPGKTNEPRQEDRPSRQPAPEALAPLETRTPDVREDRPERPGRGDRRPDQRHEGRSDRPKGERTERSERSERPERERTPLPSISDLLKEGQEIIVQIAKEPLGQKGARITSHIALPGRFVVYMPTVDHVGVSRKIPSDDERQRLKKVLQTHRQGIPGGFICRTAGDGKTEEELKSDMHFLYNLWLDMRQKAEKKPAPLLLHHDLDLVERVLRDQLTSSFKTIWVDNEEYYESILRFVQRFQPALVGRVKLYTRSTPIFDEFGVTNEVEKALRPKVWLKSGGYIVINQTEALVAIDINTGKYVGKSNRLEDTIVKINTDAIKEIVRQIRLRDLGGIIVVDFIDMDERKNRQKVMQSLEEAMRADRAPYKILQFNDFGLVAITRKRVKQSLERTLCSPCPYCEGAGYVKSVGTVIGEILQEAQRMQKSLDSDDVTLRVNPEVAKVLKSNQNTFLQEIEEIIGRTVLVKSDPLLHQTKFDLT